MAQSDYILVRDKDGQLKYYKDGTFFDVDVIKKQMSGEKTEKKNKEVIKDINREKVHSALNEKIMATVNDVLIELKVSFTDDAIERRFKNLIASRLRHVRGDKEVLYMLTVPKDEGGLGLEKKQAAVVIAVTKKHEKQLSKEHKNIAVKAVEGRIVPEPKIPQHVVPMQSNSTAGHKEVVPVKPVVTKKDKVNPLAAFMSGGPLVPPEKKTEIQKSAVSNPTAPVPEKMQAEPIKRGHEVDTRDGDAKLDSLIKQGAVPRDADLLQPRRKTTLKEKPQLKDVQYTAKTFGPVDELRALDLRNFKRLGATPDDIVDTIKEKVALLAEESLGKQFAGIDAWLHSPVVKLYREMGLESISSGKSLEKIIIDRQIGNLPVLTQSEFEAINRLNGDLVM